MTWMSNGGWGREKCFCFCTCSCGWSLPFSWRNVMIVLTLHHWTAEIGRQLSTSMLEAKAMLLKSRNKNTKLYVEMWKCWIFRYFLCRTKNICEACGCFYLPKELVPIVKKMKYCPTKGLGPASGVALDFLSHGDNVFPLTKILFEFAFVIIIRIQQIVSLFILFLWTRWF